MQFVGRIAYSSGSQLVVGNDGGVYLTNNVGRSDLVQETGEARWVQGLISGEIMLPEERKVVSFTSRPSAVK